MSNMLNSPEYGFEWIFGVFVAILVIGSIVFLRTENKKARERAQRQRQKKLDHQENVGRQIANYLNREASYWLDLQNLKVVDYWANDYFDGAGPDYLVFVVSMSEPLNVNWLSITINMFDEDKKSGKPIRVNRTGQVFDEMWPDDEKSIKLLCVNLERHIRSLYYAPAKV